jgi:hypothetical protein
MSGVFEFFEKIQKQILDLQNTINQFQQSWEKFQKFWDLFFTIVPWEVLLLLLFSVIFLSLLNSVSPATPRSNLTLAVLLLAGLWAYFWSIFSDNVGYGKIVFSSLYILLPLHAFGIGKFGYEYYRKWSFAKKRIKPRNWEESLGQISKDYNQLMAISYEKTDSILENETEIKLKIENLEKSIQGLRILFPEK